MNGLEVFAVFLMTLILYLHIRSQLNVAPIQEPLVLDTLDLAKLSQAIQSRVPVSFHVTVLRDGGSFDELRPQFVTRRDIIPLLGASSPSLQTASRHFVVLKRGECDVALWHPDYSEGDNERPQYTVKLREGRVLCVPPYWKYQTQGDEVTGSHIVFHTVFSRFASIVFPFRKKIMALYNECRS